MKWTWKSWDMLVVLAALAVGFGVWLLPSFTESKEIKELFAKQKELREQRLKVEAAEAEIAAERERLGLVYVAPVSSAPTGASPAAPAP
jgi:CRISPR/Cas system-associated protein Csx1